MSRLIFLVALIVACAANWKLYKKTHKKSYEGEEDLKRRALFSANLKVINKHNFRYDLGLTSYRMGVNHLTDLTPEEYKKLLGLMGKSSKAKHTKTHKTKTRKGENVRKPPAEIDWRNAGYVTPIKDQKDCASCWAFAATGAIEGQHFAKTKKLVSLSEQNLVDCSKKDSGCIGGLMTNAYRYVIKNKGIDTEESYPYEATGNKCRFNESTIGAKISSFVKLPREDEEALMAAVGTVGPISVGIDASPNSFRFYKEGVYDEPKCGKGLNHGVLIVGYGKENGTDYWLVKNSWGVGWGAQGYIKMSRNKKNQCGISNLASYPVI